MGGCFGASDVRVGRADHVFVGMCMVGVCQPTMSASGLPVLTPSCVTAGVSC